MGSIESRPPTFTITAGANTFTESGAWVHTAITSTNQPRTATNSVAIHEARHAVAAVRGGTDVIDVTIEKSGNAEGTTRLSRFDAGAALGPHVLGSSGTGSDVFKVLYIKGSLDGAESDAKSRLSDQTHTVNAVAVRLEDELTIDGPTVKYVMREADEDKKYGPTAIVDIFIKNQDGSVKRVRQETREKNIVISGEWFNPQNN